MGTRPDQSVYCTPQKDHPHAYGDKSETSASIPRGEGSSPRVWGQVVNQDNTILRSGIIPTRMGTSSIFSERISKSEDHPHAYGDKSLTQSGKDPSAGSSPRVWGQDINDNSSYDYCRIIPTRMGTSTAAAAPVLERKDHPHAYGDKAATPIE